MLTVADNFSKLKKEFTYHEKRMSLLMATPIAEDFGFNLEEKSYSRTGCQVDCQHIADKLESGAMDGKLSGRWTELRLSSTFGLELPLNVVVGSEKFENPTVTAADIGAIVQRVQELAGRFGEFASNTVLDNEDIAKFLKDLETLHWSPRDMTRMREAVAAKLAVLTELEDLSNVLQGSQLTLSAEQMRLEQLRRVEERAVEDGEMAVSDGAVRDKMDCIAKIIDLLFFQAHTIDSSINTNVTKRKSNLSMFQSGASVLDCVKREKRELTATCSSDLVKLQRGLEFDAVAARGKNDPMKQIKESKERLRAIDERQTFLSSRLKELWNEFSETETALRDLSVARAAATADHLDLVESSRHMNSDRMEMLKFAEQFSKNLDQTKREYEQSIGAVTSLEKVLLQQQTFDDYDFKASSKRLTMMQRRVCIEMNRSLNEFEQCAAELIRRLSANQRQLEGQIEVSSIEAELRSETFDPLTKKYVTRAKDLGLQRDKIASDRANLRDMVHRERDACVAKISQHLDKDEIVNSEELNSAMNMCRAEEILDFRQELIVPPEAGILDERFRVNREVETSGVAGNYKARRLQASSKVQTLRNDVSKGAAAVPEAINVSAVSVDGDFNDVSEVSGAGGSDDGIVANSSFAPQLIPRSNEDKTMQYRTKVRVIAQKSSE